MGVTYKAFDVHLQCPVALDALFGKKQDAIAEGKRASEMLPISEDAVDGPLILQNLAVVYAWADQPNLAFEILDSLTRTPKGVYYGELREPYWVPFEKIRALINCQRN